MSQSKLALQLAITIASCVALASPAMSQEETPLIPSPLVAPPQAGAAFNRPASAISPVTTMSSEGKEAFTERRPRLVLALSGGAMKAVAEIGVLRSLEQHHVKIDGIIGTSMGATIGALYCAGMSVDDIEKLFLDNTIHTALLKGCLARVLARPIAPLKYIFTGRPYYGITSGAAYLKLLESKLPRSFKQLKLPFAAVVTNITDGQTTVLGDGDLPKAVLASNCFPLFYRPVMIDQKLYVDGGLKANLPSNIAESMGADIVVSVLVDAAVKHVPNKIFKSKKELMFRIIDIMMASSDKMQTRSSDVLIYPNVDFLDGLAKDPALLKRAIAAGGEAADAVVPRIITDVLAIGKGKPRIEQKESDQKPASDAFDRKQKADDAAASKTVSTRSEHLN